MRLLTYKKEALGLAGPRRLRLGNQELFLFITAAYFYY